MATAILSKFQPKELDNSDKKQRKHTNSPMNYGELEPLLKELKRLVKRARDLPDPENPSEAKKEKGIWDHISNLASGILEHLPSLLPMIMSLLA